MTTIWKFLLEVTDTQDVKMPRGARILTVDVQHGTPCLWALVDGEQPRESRHIQMYGTGHSFDPVPSDYIGTFQLSGGSLVFHVFENI